MDACSMAYGSQIGGFERDRANGLAWARRCQQACSRLDVCADGLCD